MGDWMLSRTDLILGSLGLFLVLWCSAVVLATARAAQARQTTSLRHLLSSLEETLRSTPMRRLR